MVGREILIERGPTDGEERAEVEDLAESTTYFTPEQIDQNQIVAWHRSVETSRVDSNEKADVGERFADEVEGALVAAKQFDAGKDQNDQDLSNQSQEQIQNTSAETVEICDVVDRLECHFNRHVTSRQNN